MSLEHMQVSLNIAKYLSQYSNASNKCQSAYLISYTLDWALNRGWTLIRVASYVIATIVQVIQKSKT